MTTQEMQIPELTFGWRLRMARETRGFEQSEMAKQLGVSRPAIAQWEHDQRRPRDLLWLVRRWSDITNVPQSWLLGIDANSSIRPGHLSTDGEQPMPLWYPGWDLWLPVSRYAERAVRLTDTQAKHSSDWVLTAA